MHRVVENLLCRALLHNESGVHDDYARAGFGDDAEVVGDHPDSHVGVATEVTYEVENLCLDGHVESGRRLVGDEKGRIAAQSHGDHNSLSHTAGHLEWVGVHAFFGERKTDLTEHFDSDAPCLFFTDILVEGDSLADLVPDGHEGIEAGHGVLEDHGDLVSADFSHFRDGKFKEVVATEKGSTASDLAGGDLDEPHY